MKIVLVLLDGIGDRSYEVLDHQTPLQAAVTPNLDRLAFLGGNGLFHASSPGECLPSEMAHYLLLGYEPEKFPGRGLLEAVGYGVVFDDSDVLCLAHISSVTWETGEPILAEKRPDVKEADLGQLFAAIPSYDVQGIRFRLQQTGGNNAILIMSGEVSPYISDSDPMVVGKAIAGIFPLSNNSEPKRAALTAMALNEYLTCCHRVLTDHEINRSRQAKDFPPANFLTTQRCGRRIVQESFDKRWGLTGMMIASGSVYEGLAREIGVKFVRAEDGSDPGEDLRERVDMALADPSHDFIHVHTKVPDEAAHTGDPQEKEAAIAALDRGLDVLVKSVESRDDLLVAVTADHSTPSISPLIHSGEPVPVALIGPTVRRDEISTFDEVKAAAGCLGLLRGRELMLMMLNCADRSALMGHRLGGEERLYVPHDYESFKLTPD